MIRKTIYLLSITAFLGLSSLSACSGDEGDADVTTDLSDGITDSSDASDTHDAGGDTSDGPEKYWEIVAPNSWGPMMGSGVPPVSFTEEQLFQNCAFLDVGALSEVDHYNLATMYDGYVLQPVAPEYGVGGLSFWDISEPCSPELVSQGASETMRETHSLGFTWLDGRAITSTAYLQSVLPLIDEDTGEFVSPGGIQVWDISDTGSPEHIVDFATPDHFYPDAYARVVLSTAMQGPNLFVGQTDTGVHALDISDPENPVLVGTYEFDPILRVGQVQAIGNLLVVTGAETPDTALLDITDPSDMKLIPNGRFQTQDAEGEVRDFYFSTMVGGIVYYAQKENGGGVIAYDIRDPSNAVYRGSYNVSGNGGYVFVHEGKAFVGQSNFGQIYDVSDLTNITPYGERFMLPGDLDTVTPLGHLAMVAVDDDAEDDMGMAVSPWSTEPDDAAPVLEWSQPVDGATDFPVNGRFGVTFNEWVEPTSVFRGSMRLIEVSTGRQLAGTYSVQETIANFAPAAPLEPGSEYELVIPAGGIEDLSGNPVEDETTIRITTAN